MSLTFSSIEPRTFYSVSTHNASSGPILVRVPQFPRRLASLVLTLCVLLFLWLPPLQLYGEALRQIVLKDPTRLLEALPLAPLPRILFLNTAILCVLSAALAVLFGLPVGWLMARASQRIRTFVMLLAALPLALPPMLMATAWLEITRTPPARSLASLGATTASPFPPVLIASVLLALCYFPLPAFAINAALRTIPSETEDAARLAGGAWSVWRGVLLPVLAPALWGAAGLVAALAMWEMGAPDLLDARTYSVQIYREVNAVERHNPALAALPMLFLGVLAFSPALRALQKYRTGRGDAPRGSAVSGLALVLTLLLFIASPLAPLVIFGLQARPLDVFPRIWNANSVELENSIMLATLGSLGITVLAFCLVTSWRRWPIRSRNRALAMCVAPLLVPPVLSGIAIIQFYNRPAFALIYGGLAPTGNPILDPLSDWLSRYAVMLIGYTVRFLPLAILFLHEAMNRIDKSQVEAAEGLGAGEAKVTLTIVWPALKPALAGTFALIWALCAGELSTSVLINAPGGQTLPVPIFNLMHIGSTAEVAALSLTLFALSGLAAMLGFRALRQTNT
jgi:iron(III) transport system permease protein